MAALQRGMRIDHKHCPGDNDRGDDHLWKAFPWKNYREIDHLPWEK
jgi:hypothetical protein